MLDVRALGRRAALPQVDGDRRCREREEGEEPEGGRDPRRDDDERERADRDQQEPESRILAPERALHRRTSSEKVDRRVHDDPHHVDEVPVDAGKLDAVVVLGRVVAAEAADDHHQQQAQPDGDVRPVQAGEAEEHGRERAVAGVEADVQVLDDLRAAGTRSP